MTQEPRHIPENLTWIGAVYNTEAASSSPIGTAALVGNGLLATARHVVDPPGGSYWVTFPFAALPTVQESRVPVDEIIRADHGTDIALLRLYRSENPSGVVPAEVSSSPANDVVGPFWTYGYATKDGDSAAGVFGDPLAHGMLRLDTESRYVLKKGFSGAGVWSREMDAVVCVVVQVSPDGTTHPGDGRAVTFAQIANVFRPESLSGLFTKERPIRRSTNKRKSPPRKPRKAVSAETGRGPAKGTSPVEITGSIDSVDIEVLQSIAASTGRSQALLEEGPMRVSVASDGSLHFSIAYPPTRSPDEIVPHELVGIWQWAGARYDEYLELRSDGFMDARVWLFGALPPLKVSGQWWYVSKESTVGASAVTVVPAELMGFRTFFEWGLPVKIVDFRPDVVTAWIPEVEVGVPATQLTLTRSNCRPW